MNRTIHATTNEQRGIGRVYDRVHVERRDVAADDLDMTHVTSSHELQMRMTQRYFSHQAGLLALTRANHRHIGINTARTAAQHR